MKAGVAAGHPATCEAGIEILEDGGSAPDAAVAACVAAGLAELSRAHGRLPWVRLVEPALRLARDGVPMPYAHVRCLEMLESVLTLDAGARIYKPGGRLLRDGDLLEQPGLVRALELLRDEGADSVYSGSIAEALLTLCKERGGVITHEDLAGYRATWTEPVEVAFAGTRYLTRAGLSGVPDTLGSLPPHPDVVALVEALDLPEDRSGDTTNLVTVDADGNACVLTTSLGLGSGDYLPGLDLHLNSMLGEADLVRGEARPGRRMSSMMAPS